MRPRPHSSVGGGEICDYFSASLDSSSDENRAGLVWNKIRYILNYAQSLSIYHFISHSCLVKLLHSFTFSVWSSALAKAGGESSRFFLSLRLA